MIGICQRCRKLMTDRTSDSNCLASHHSSARRPAMPTSSSGRIRRQRVFTVPLSTNTMLLPTKIGISTHSAGAVLLLEAVDGLGRHAEEAR